MEREAALMEAGRARLRPILMMTFALIAGVVPVAVGLGERGEFYRPLAIAIMVGTITATVLTLLVVPAFYDSIEIARSRMFAKFRRRMAAGNPLVALVQTAVQAVLALTMVRGLYRAVADTAQRSGQRSAQGQAAS